MQTLYRRLGKFYLYATTISIVGVATSESYREYLRARGKVTTAFFKRVTDKWGGSSLALPVKASILLTEAALLAKKDEEAPRKTVYSATVEKIVSDYVNEQRAKTQ